MRTSSASFFVRFTVFFGKGDSSSPLLSDEMVNVVARERSDDDDDLDDDPDAPKVVGKPTHN